MLKIKCFRNFKRGEPFVVVVGQDEDYLRASEFLDGKEFAFLNDPKIAIYYETSIISNEHLYLTKEECQGLAEIFYSLGTRNGGSCHDYFDTKALDDIEILIAYNEYSDKIFEEDDDDE